MELRENGCRLVAIKATKVPSHVREFCVCAGWWRSGDT
jgi:hypothetical protein